MYILLLLLCRGQQSGVTEGEPTSDDERWNTVYPRAQPVLMEDVEEGAEAVPIRANGMRLRDNLLHAPPERVPQSRVRVLVPRSGPRGGAHDLCCISLDLFCISLVLLGFLHRASAVFTALSRETLSPQ